MTGQKFLGVGKIAFRQNDAEVHGFEQAVGDGAGSDLHGRLQPFGEAGGVPVENDSFEKRAAEEHDQPVAIKRDVLARRGHVIKIGHAVAKPAPDRFETINEKLYKFEASKFTDVFESPGKLRVNVVALNAETVRRFVAGFRFAPAVVAAEAVQHEVH